MCFSTAAEENAGLLPGFCPRRMQIYCRRNSNIDRQFVYGNCVGAKFEQHLVMHRQEGQYRGVFDPPLPITKKSPKKTQQKITTSIKSKKEAGIDLDRHLGTSKTKTHDPKTPLPRFLPPPDT
jgi:hypothetical protein